jgi:restriction endonuclease S subunit
MSELYKLPDGWEWKKLGDLAEYINGMAFKPEDFTESGYPIIRIQNLNGKNQFNYFNGEAKERYYVKNGDILISWSASLDVYKWNGGDAILNQHIFNTNINLKLVNYDFFYHIIKYALKEIMNNLHGVGMKHITKGKFENIKIPLPPLPEQQRIVSKLDLLFEKIDRSIALHQKNMDEAKAFMGSVLNDVFGELNTDKKISLKNITKKIGSGSTPRGGQKAYKTEGVSLIRSMNVHDNGFRSKGLAFIDDEQAKKLDNVAIEENDVLLNITGASVARCCIVDKNYLPARVNQHVSILRLKDGMIPSFLHYYMISPSVKSDLLFSSSGGATREAITKSMLEKFQVPLTSVPVQQKVVSYLDEISQKIEKIKQLQKEKTESLKALKASILDQAFRGEL